MNNQCKLIAWVLISSLFLNSQVSAQRMLGLPPTPALQEIPTQSYVAIDINGESVGANVTNIILTDDNHVAYCYTNSSNQTVINTWFNGQTNLAQTLAAADPANTYAPSRGASRTESVGGCQLSLDASGKAYLSYSEALTVYDGPGFSYPYYLGTISGAFSYANSNKAPASVPCSNFDSSWQGVATFHGYPWLYAAGWDLAGSSTAGLFGHIQNVIVNASSGGNSSYQYDYGTYTGTFGGIRYGMVSFVKSGGTTIIFDSGLSSRTADSIPSGADYSIIKGTYDPYFMNSSGRSAGTDGNSSHYEALTAPAGSSSLQDLGQGKVVGLSDDNRVIIVQNPIVNGRAIDKGRVQGITDGAMFSFNDFLARTIYKSYDSCSPFLISNQNQADQSYDVLTQISDGKNLKTLLWKYGSPGNKTNGTPLPARWNPYEMSLPQGVTIQRMTGINSSGVIAAIGNAGTGDGHALLLVPVNFDVKKWKPSTTDPQVNIVGGIAVLIAPPAGFDALDISSETTVSVPAAFPGADDLAKEWDIYLFQDIESAKDAGTVKYTSETYSPILSNLPGQDSNTGGVGGADPDDIPKVKSFSSNNQTIELSFEDSAAERGPFDNRYDDRPGKLVSMTKDLTFRTFLFAQHRKTKNRVFLKWLSWQIIINVNFDFSKSPPQKVNVLKAKILDSGDGVGPKAPIDAPPLRSDKYVPPRPN